MDGIAFFILAFGLLGALIVPTALKFFSAGATVDAVGAWSFHHGFVIDASSKTPAFPFVDYHGKVSAHGKLFDHDVVVGVGLGGFSTRQVPVTYFQTILPGYVLGQVLVRTTDAMWVGQMKHVELESTMFRNFLMVFARPAKLSTAIMSTDFMDWYQHQHIRPVIYASGNTLCMMFQKYLTSEELEFLATQVPKIATFVIKSGVLEEKGT